MARFNAALRTLTFHFYMEGVWAAEARAFLELEPLLSIHSLVLDEVVGKHIMPFLNRQQSHAPHEEQVNELRQQWRERMRRRNRLYELLRELPSAVDAKQLNAVAVKWWHEMFNNEIPSTTPDYYDEFIGSRMHDEQQRNPEAFAANEATESASSGTDETAKKSTTEEEGEKENKEKKDNGKRWWKW
jgi:hypothetical protein